MMWEVILRTWLTYKFYSIQSIVNTLNFSGYTLSAAVLYAWFKVDFSYLHLLCQFPFIHQIMQREDYPQDLTNVTYLEILSSEAPAGDIVDVWCTF